MYLRPNDISTQEGRYIAIMTYKQNNNTNVTTSGYN